MLCARTPTAGQHIPPNSLRLYTVGGVTGTGIPRW